MSGSTGGQRFLDTPLTPRELQGPSEEEGVIHEEVTHPRQAKASERDTSETEGGPSWGTSTP